MKTTKLLFVASVFALASISVQAQGLRGAIQKTKEKVQEVQGKAQGVTSGVPETGKAGINASANNGPSLYVSVETGAGSRTADGTKDKPYKDLQAAIDAATEGAVIRVAGGNYLGKMEQGFIELKKYITIEGGWNTDFSERDPKRYLTMVQPKGEHSSTAGNHGLIDVIVKGNRSKTVVIDGLIFDMGFETQYAAAPNSDPVAGAPEGCETGRIILIDDKPNVPKTDGVSSTRQCMYGAVEGNFILRNCVIANGYHYGIQMENCGGHWEFYNNIFVACRMAACEVRGNGVVPETETTLNFHHNTVLFPWCRDKLMEDMGYGFRYMTRMNYDVYDNIFGGANYAALDRTRFDSDLKRDKVRKTNAWDNLFFANRMGDICLPSGGGKWNFQFARNFEEVEQLEKYENNREVNEAEIEMLKKVISQPYLKGFLSLQIKQNSQYDENSSMNTFRSAFGMNKQGTETIRVNMYANRYPLADAIKLWGAIPGKGAQVLNK